MFLQEIERELSDKSRNGVFKRVHSTKLRLVIPLLCFSALVHVSILAICSGIRDISASQTIALRDKVSARNAFLTIQKLFCGFEFDW